MKFFVDGTDIQEIRELSTFGIVDGITTNPTLIAKSGRDFKEIIAEMCTLTHGPVSAEVISTTAAEMIKEGEELSKIASNVCIKVPLTADGLKACHYLRSKNIGVNVTLCFSAGQALMAAKAGASFVSPFVGRLDDISEDGMQLIADINAIYKNYPALKTEILVASVRHPRHIIEAGKLGAQVVTAPSKVIFQLLNHPLTTKGLADFLQDWKSTGQKAL